MEDKHIILKVRSGSHMYGTATPESDTDYVGIFIPTIEYYFGMKTVEEVNESVKSVGVDGRNTAEAIDCKYYEIRQFFKLAYENNPNILEILFSNESNIIQTTPFADKILDNKHLFLGKVDIHKKFLAYASTQKKRMLAKPEYYEEILKFYDSLNTFDEKMYLMEVPGIKPFIDKGYIRVGNLSIPVNIYIKRVRNIIKQKIHRVGNRRDLILKHGLDSKFAHHLLRLLLEARRLLLTGNLVFPLPEEEHDILMEVKTGKWDYNKVASYAEKLEQECNETYMHSIVQSKPNYNKINALLMESLSEHFKVSYS